ncbi:NADH-dependent formate dehydrogenase delta subunit FdsD [Ferrovum sp. JA12]|uniref:formate dehydrogenase subunit delta n=1 Tax=Ferrovum sp. JA12 TaxID=1356299 RepID=UPI000715AA71|nr:formate dehydrogenase subunit delta [Ferrovum sp. JA12]KRH79732.1 NADH-dependent formate dehydrogenase delta subunit FdsD [Ferrovum sp. JA12]
MMNPHHLIKMANAIGDFFSSMPDREQAARDAASHIKRFWEKRMQQSFFDYIKEHGDEELKPIMKHALTFMNEELGAYHG